MLGNYVISHHICSSHSVCFDSGNVEKGIDLKGALLRLSNFFFKFD